MIKDAIANFMPDDTGHGFKRCGASMIGTFQPPPHCCTHGGSPADKDRQTSTSQFLRQRSKIIRSKRPLSFSTWVGKLKAVFW